jgi:hypothetical protein
MALAILIPCFGFVAIVSVIATVRTCGSITELHLGVDRGLKHSLGPFSNEFIQGALLIEPERRSPRVQVAGPLARLVDLS